MTTFVVPVYNAEAWIDDCAASILGQTVADLELVLVDDGSTDVSAARCRAIAAADRRVRLLQTPHVGPSAARNAGVEAAKGSHVVFVDADDMVHPRLLEVLLDMLSDTGARAAICAFAAKPSRMKAAGRVRTLDVPVLIRRVLYQDGYDSSLCGKLLPVGALRLAPLREGIRYEDLDAVYRVYEALGPGAKVAATTARLYMYRPHRQSFVHRFTPERLDVLDVTDRICHHYSGDSLLGGAARDRRFSAACNMFVLASRAASAAGSPDAACAMREAARKCWDIVTSGRHDELRDPRVRFKNKLGAFLSHLGPRVFLAVSRLVYR